MLHQGVLNIPYVIITVRRDHLIEDSINMVHVLSCCYENSFTTELIERFLSFLSDINSILILQDFCHHSE